MNKDIIKLVREIKSIELIDSQINELIDLLSVTNERSIALELVINTKLNKINALEKNTFLSIFSKLVRDHDEILEISREHYLNLCLEYNEILQEIEIIKFEINILQNKTYKISTVKKELRDLIKKELSETINKELLSKHKKLIKEIEFNLRLEKEMEEAIREGVVLNRRFNEAINFLKKVAKGIYDNKTKKVVLKDIYQVKNLDKFQLRILKIKHSMLKFKAEINDVYSELQMTDIKSRYYTSSFIHEYRRKLTRDIIIKKDLNRSFNHLIEQKQLILEFNKTLRRDLKTIKKQIIYLEIEENKFIKSIT